MKKKMYNKLLWPLPFTQGDQIQSGPSQWCKQLYSENCVQISTSVWLEFCSQADFRQTHTHRQTDTHRQTVMKI